MQVIVSHVNTDFDALASIIAANKLYPDAKPVVSTQQDNRVRRFLNIYRDTFQLYYDHEIEWKKVSQLILVDVASLNRIGQFHHELNEENLRIIVYDHHMIHKDNVKKYAGCIEQVGATVTLLIEKIKKRKIKISSLEATLFGLGIYTDTGSFTFKQTTSRDYDAASFLMKEGMDLEIVQQFSEQTLQEDQQALLDTLFQKAETIEIEGLEIIISTCHEKKVVRDLATVTTKLLDIKMSDAVIVTVGMKRDVFVVGRARSKRISLQPLLKKLGGGGHHHAGAATLKKENYEEIYEKIKSNLSLIIRPATTAKEIMTSPVKTILEDISMEEAGKLMYRYGHSGYPVVDENDQLVGIITRRDLDKANHHGLGHAPVKAYMTTNIITASIDDPLEDVQQMIIDHNIGRLPVVENKRLIGIISRTNIIEAIHGSRIDESMEEIQKKTNLKERLKRQLPNDIYSLLCKIGQQAKKMNMSVYLIGGIVRDFLLNVSNDDIDIVVEGDGIKFVKSLKDIYGGDIIIHESFKTATWIHPSGREVDVASSRLEYYDKPGSLPNVETSTLEEDLHRRDFTINAIGIYLNEDRFGDIVDPFSGQNDLLEKKIKVLHNMSFIEDPTRIFRAVRFEVRFGFLMDEQTEKLALYSIEKVNELSVERIVNEMKRLFIEEDPYKVMKRLYELTFWHQFGLVASTKNESNQFLKQLKGLYEVIDEKQSLRWFHMFIIPFYLEDKLAKAHSFAIKKEDMTFLKEISALKKIDLAQYETIAQLHPLLKPYGNDAILFKVALDAGKLRPLIVSYLTKRTRLIPYLTGDDLKKMGIKPGPLYAEIFLNLENAILSDKVKSKKDSIDWVKNYLSKKK